MRKRHYFSSLSDGFTVAAGAGRGVESAVNIGNFSSHARCQIAKQKRSYIAHVVNRDIAAHRRRGGHHAEQLAKVLDATGGQCFDGAGAQAIDTHAFWTQRLGQVTH